MEEEKMLTLEKFEEASEVVRRVTLETKLVYSDYFSQQTGAKVFFKPENLQFTGAYKVRGAYYKMSTLTEEERAKGVITASAGNHAQGVAYAAKCYGAKATIVMPTITPLIKVNRTKGYGAEVVLYGDVYDEACAHAYELAEKQSVNPLCYNGDLYTREQIRNFAERFPGTERLMFGRGFLRDPGLLYNEGKDSKDIFEKFWAFHDLVYEGYQERNMGDRNVLFKMKELWSYQVYQFSEPERLFKTFKKVQDCNEYEQMIRNLRR